MKIAIIGWYGTETIGDRAILVSLLKILTESVADFEINLGSIYPFFSERTIFEDKRLIEDYCKRKIEINLFDSRNHTVLKKKIKETDCIIVGGGPLMDLGWMYMIEYAFMKAKKMGKKTALLGCGIGPLHKKKYLNATKNIIKYSDLLIFRDYSSMLNAKKICPEKSCDMHTLIDPAVFVAMFYKQHQKEHVDENYVVINLREFPQEYVSQNTQRTKQERENAVFELVYYIAKNEKKIKFIPMHYFGIGGDDRSYLNKIKNLYNLDNVEVQNDPLSLSDTMRIFLNAKYCVGMRFHSVVLQTILNGNNYIIDYTDVNDGKISGFIKEIGGEAFYRDRYANLQSVKSDDFVLSENKFTIETERLDIFFDKYVSLIKDWIQ